METIDQYMESAMTADSNSIDQSLLDNLDTLFLALRNVSLLLMQGRSRQIQVGLSARAKELILTRHGEAANAVLANCLTVSVAGSQASTARLSSKAAPQASRQGEATDWKLGNEFLPFHASASHIEPGYRDGWNACYYASLNSPHDQVRSEES